MRALHDNKTRACFVGLPSRANALASSGTKRYRLVFYKSNAYRKHGLGSQNSLIPAEINLISFKKLAAVESRSIVNCNCRCA
jgi:hypothetical protein